VKKDRAKDVMATLRTGVWVAAALIPLQIVVGDMHGLNTLHHQPAKLAAMEGIWETQSSVPAVLFAIPDQATQSNKYEIAIPKLASFYLTHDWNGEVKGIKDFPEHPPVGPVFWAFRIMVGVGLLMLFISWFASYELKFKNTMSQHTAMVLVAMTFAGWVALISGWYVTEIGRQPWLVYGLLTTAQAASQVPQANIALTLAMYLTLYSALLSAYVSVVFYLAQKAVNGGAESSANLKGMSHV
jgi:cytochrome d ubiquinol oxidase subunit I